MLWVHADTKPHFEQRYYNIANALRIPGRDESDIDILRLVKDALLRPDIGKWILILDGLDDSSMLPLVVDYLAAVEQPCLLPGAQTSLKDFVV